MDIATKQDLLAHHGRRFKVVEIKGLPKPLRLGSFSAARSFDFRRLHERKEKGEDVTEEMILFTVSSCVVDGVGRPLFTMDEAREFMERVSPEAALEVITAVNAFVAETTEEPITVGNSEGSPSSSSPTTSPSL